VSSPLILRLVALLIGGAFLTSCKTVDSDQRSFLSSYDGFTAASKGGALVYAGDRSKLKGYDKVHVSDVEVLVDVEDDNKTSRAELNQLAVSFESILKEEFGQKFEITRSRGPGVLEVRAALVDVEPNSPAWFLAGYAPGVFVATSALWAATGDNPGSGVTTVQVEVLDSASKERLYAIIDEERGGKHKVRGGLSRWGQAEISFRKWSQKIVEAVSQP
tara:strand:+ start:17558 stop:18211 length:654 start_codon:yes stop_codon:yes gene_type:complete